MNWLIIQYRLYAVAFGLLNRKLIQKVPEVPKNSQTDPRSWHKYQQKGLFLLTSRCLLHFCGIAENLNELLLPTLQLLGRTCYTRLLQITFRLDALISEDSEKKTHLPQQSTQLLWNLLLVEPVHALPHRLHQSLWIPKVHKASMGEDKSKTASTRGRRKYFQL